MLTLCVAVLPALSYATTFIVWLLCAALSLKTKCPDHLLPVKLAALTVFGLPLKSPEITTCCNPESASDAVTTKLNSAAFV